MSSLFPALRTGFIKALLPGRGGGGLLTSGLQRRVVRGLRKCSSLRGWTRVSGVQEGPGPPAPNCFKCPYEMQTPRNLYFGWLLGTFHRVKKKPRSDHSLPEASEDRALLCPLPGLDICFVPLSGPGQNLLSKQTGPLCSCAGWRVPSSQDAWNSYLRCKVL